MACNYHTRAILRHTRPLLSQWAILRHTRPLLSQSTALTLACGVVNSRLDYCNSLLNGAPASSINKLQRVQNTAARTVLNSCGRSYSTALLRTLHLLPVCQRILYKTALLTFKVKKTSLSEYLNWAGVRAALAVKNGTSGIVLNPL